MVCGSSEGSLGGPNVNPGRSDAWLLRYDATGGRTWSRQFGTPGGDAANAVAVYETSTFLGGTTTDALGGPNVGRWDAWLARHDDQGKQDWIVQFGTTDEDSVQALEADAQGGVFVAGVTFFPSLWESDAWIARWGEESCYPDCDTSTGPGNLDVFDFLCFQNRYVAFDPYACNCDTSTGPGVCDVFDFLCFQNAFDVGCP